MKFLGKLRDLLTWFADLCGAFAAAGFWAFVLPGVVGMLFHPPPRLLFWFGVVPTFFLMFGFLAFRAPGWDIRQSEEGLSFRPVKRFRKYKVAPTDIRRVVVRDRKPSGLPVFLDRYLYGRRHPVCVTIWTDMGLDSRSNDSGFDALIAWLREQEWDMDTAIWEAAQNPGADIDTKKFVSY